MLRLAAHGRKFFLQMLLSFAALLFASAAMADAVAPKCLPAPTAPSPEKLQELLRNAKDHGFLWSVERNGRSSYLFGTMHANKLEWFVPGPKTLAALQQSDTIALELDILDEQTQKQLADPSKLGFGNIVLPAPLQQRMDIVAKRLCAPEAALAKQHPILQLSVLAILDARANKLEAGYGSEFFLAGFARGARKSVRALETPEGQLKALLGAPEKQNLELVDAALRQLETGTQRQEIETLVKVWGTGDLDTLEKYEQWCGCVTTPAERAFMKRLNDDRNADLAAGIDRAIREGRNVFAAVGSLHMVGPNALPKLLVKMGYHVERIPFDAVPEPATKPATKSAEKDKAKAAKK